MQSDSRIIAFIEHLRRFPEDILDIRRLQASFGLSTVEISEALDEVA